MYIIYSFLRVRVTELPILRVTANQYIIMTDHVFHMMKQLSGAKTVEYATSILCKKSYESEEAEKERLGYWKGLQVVFFQKTDCSG